LHPDDKKLMTALRAIFSMIVDKKLGGILNDCSKVDVTLNDSLLLASVYMLCKQDWQKVNRTPKPWQGNLKNIENPWNVFQHCDSPWSSSSIIITADAFF